MSSCRRRLARLLPTIAVGLLLLVTVASSSRTSATSAAGAAPEIQSSFGDCSLISEPVITGFETLQGGGALVQPLGTAGNLQACSLTVVPNVYVYGRLDVLLWDPTALAPDPTTVALRSLAYSISTTATWESKLGIGFGNTIVTQAVPGVADPPRSTTALELRAYFGNGTVGADPNSASSSPSALSVGPSGTYQPLPGSHPVLSHFVCGGDAGAQDLRLIQCVMTANTLNPGSGVVLAQKFRVPVAAALQTVEIAVAPADFVYGDYGQILVLDAEGQSEPPVDLSGQLFSAQFVAPLNSRAAWIVPFGGSSTPALVPNHDYWLIVDTGLRFMVYMKTLTGTESPYFTTGIGPMFSRSASAHPFNPIPGYALDFRIIGTPTGTVSVGTPAPLRRALALSVAPNPARGNVNVTWSSAVAGVRFEVLDERGRRVSLGDWQTAAEGRWTWSALNNRGQPVPAGVYFLRAVDGLGVRAMQRVVVLR
jgi:hypothetical protein